MNCDVIKDLLPLYVDECCSEESVKLVADHLATCESCRKAHNQMLQTCQPQKETPKPAPLQRISDWKASLLQSVMLFVSFAILTLGVILEGATPTGATNGLWAVALIVPATGYLLSLANWFFLRIYKNRKIFSFCSCFVTLGFTLAGYAWAAIHYGGKISVLSPLVWVGVALSAVLCFLSKLLSNRYALLLGRE
ncbi:MAG: zf-HC2 domain-containing protein [Oscillospiraceae bacterium]|nr:zf-HC2 domain-containing protein [Oscillospiraceae bacterium]